jgi:hypothetical protein
MYVGKNFTTKTDTGKKPENEVINKKTEELKPQGSDAEVKTDDPPDITKSILYVKPPSQGTSVASFNFMDEPAPVTEEPGPGKPKGFAKAVRFMLDLLKPALDGVPQGGLNVDAIFGTDNKVFIPSYQIETQPVGPLLFDQYEISNIKMKLNREPYRGWWQGIEQQARQGVQNVDLYANQNKDENSKAEMAKNLAFAYVLTDNKSYLEAAKKIMLSITESHHTGVLGDDSGKWGKWIESASAVQAYSVAYSLLDSTGSLEKENDPKSKTEHEKIRNSIGLEASKLYNGIAFAPVGNWKIRTASALGTAALALHGSPSVNGSTPQQWLDRAVNSLSQGFTGLSRDGVFSEGPSYASYSSDLFIPFAKYYEKATHINILQNQVISNYNDWMLKISQPDGKFPALDDSYEGTSATHLLLVDPSVPNASDYQWYVKNSNITSAGRHNPEAITFYNDYVPSYNKPSLPLNNFMEKGGMTTFRSDWTSKATYGVFAGETGWDIDHEHYDPGNFQLYAQGKKLTASPGYGPDGFQTALEKRKWYISPEANNGILIDGMGTNTNRHNTMSDNYAVPGLAASQMKTSYQDTNLERNMFFVDDDFFVVVDEMKSEKEHEYEYVLHGLGNMSQNQKDQVTWQQSGGVNLKTVFVNEDQNNFQINQRQGHHMDGGEKQHTYIKAKKKGTEEQFVSLLLPEGNGKNFNVQNQAVTTTGKASGKLIEASHLPGQQYQVISSDGTEVTSGNIKAQAKFIMAKESGTKLKQITLENATSFSYANNFKINSNVPLDASLKLDNQEIHGHISSPGNQDKEYEVTIETGYRPANILFDRKPVPFEYTDGKIILKLKGSGALDIGTAVQASTQVELPPVYTPVSAILPRLIGATDARQVINGLSDTDRAQLNYEILEVIDEQALEPVIDKLAKDLGYTSSEFKDIITQLRGLQLYASHFKEVPLAGKFEQEIGKSKISVGGLGFVGMNGARIGRANVGFELNKFRMQLGQEHLDPTNVTNYADFGFGDIVHTNMSMSDDKLKDVKTFQNNTQINIGKVGVYGQYNGKLASGAKIGDIETTYGKAGITYKGMDGYFEQSETPFVTDESKPVLSNQEPEKDKANYVGFNQQHKNISSNTRIKLPDNDSKIGMDNSTQFQVNKKLTLQNNTIFDLGNKESLQKERISAHYFNEKFNSSGGVNWSAENINKYYDLSMFLSSDFDINKNAKLYGNFMANRDRATKGIELGESNINLNLKKNKVQANTEVSRNRNPWEENKFYSNFGSTVNYQLTDKWGATAELYGVEDNNDIMCGKRAVGLCYSSQQFGGAFKVGQGYDLFSQQLMWQTETSLNLNLDKLHFAVSPVVVDENGLRSAIASLNYDNPSRFNPGIKFTYNKGTLADGATKEVMNLGGTVIIDINKKKKPKIK